MPDAYEWMCGHCVTEGTWPEDPEDVCPDCRAKGHVGVWRVGSCKACNDEYFAKMAEIKARMEARIAAERGDA